MIYDTHDPAFSGFPDMPEEYDVCIVGSGPAGIIACCELIYSGLRICVLESGLHAPSAFADSLKAVVVEGLPIATHSRERIVGGSSKTWRGISVPLDPIDFVNRPEIPASGWPKPYDHFVPYLKRCVDYGFPPLLAFESAPLSRGDPAVIAKEFLIQKKPVHFGRKYSYIFRRDGIDLFTGVSVSSLELDERGLQKNVSTAHCRTENGAELVIKAKTFVLAAGAIENARILLNSKDSAGAALGNEHDQVGRYFMNHPKGYVGAIAFSKPISVGERYFNASRGDFCGYTGLRLSEGELRARGILNTTIQIEEVVSWTRGSAFRKALACMADLKRLAADMRRRALAAAARDLYAVLIHGLALIPETPRLLQMVFEYAAFRRHPAVKCGRVRAFLDMEPCPENRITLSESKDVLGVPIPVVQHTVGERDIESLDALLAEFERWSAKTGLGTFKRLSTPLKSAVATDAAHHLGGTRMGSDPRTSVVDSDLRVHSVGNLYVAGGSVFPTGGCANPTMMIAALSIRLAEHLRACLEVLHPHAASRALGPRTIVIGAGRRVTDDALPVLEALGADIRSVFAHSSGVLWGNNRRYDVISIGALTQRHIDEAQFLYLAVPPTASASVLKSLSVLDCSRIELIMDTPTPYGKDARSAYARFKRVQVAEDIGLLPWIELVRKAGTLDGSFGRIKSVILRSCGYRYHGVALAKALIGHRPHGGLHAPRYTSLFFRRARAYITGAISYASGSIEVVGSKATASSEIDATLPIRCLIENGRCMGFALADREIRLSSIESELAGPFSKSETIVTRMAELKRVGLYRLFGAAFKGEEVYSLESGIDDARIDRRLRRIGFFLYR